jgi:hypothetical protein
VEVDKVTSEGFGLTIAFVAPGAVVLWGIAQHSAVLRSWFGFPGSETDVSAGGFLFVLLASSAAGVFVSGIRWIVFDQIFFRLIGLTRPDIDESQMRNEEYLRAYMVANEYFYRYYQFYSNMAVAVVVAYLSWLVQLDEAFAARHWGLLILAVLALDVLIISAHSALSNFYRILGKVFIGGGSD